MSTPTPQDEVHTFDGSVPLANGGYASIWRATRDGVELGFVADVNISDRIRESLRTRKRGALLELLAAKYPLANTA